MSRMIWECKTPEEQATSIADNDATLLDGYGHPNIEDEDWQAAQQIAVRFLAMIDSRPVDETWVEYNFEDWNRPDEQCDLLIFANGKTADDMPKCLSVCVSRSRVAVMLDGAMLLKNPTCGQLRSLCFALGISLREPEPEE